MDIGNKFENKTVSYGHARKVWREIRHVYPAGGVISNVAAWRSASKDIIPAGTPCKIDMANSTITCYLDSAVSGTADAAALAALGINGLLLEDVNISGSNPIVATGTVVYEGEIYSYMLASAVLAKLVTLTTMPGIVYVN